MKDTQDHIEVVIRARQGDQEAVSQLTEMASQRLSQFVFRLTLQEELTQDIVQESLVDMLKFFPTLKHTDRFWYWLYGIAYNKIGRHFQRERVRRSVSLDHLNPESVATGTDQTVAEAISQELREIVGRSMQQIDPNHRAILTMRCYDQMSYAEIAQLMHCTEFSARSLFYRAKKALARRLAGYGLEKGALLTALVVFGKMTATSKAAAAHMTLTAASLQVGPGVACFCTLLSRTAVLWIGGLLLTTGAVVGGIQKSPSQNPGVNERPFIQKVASTSRDQQRWFYYPQGTAGPVMIRSQARADEQNSHWHILQNAQGNFIWEDQTITFRNAHALWGGQTWTHPGHDSARATLLLEEYDPEGVAEVHQITHQNGLQEDYFQPDWPVGVQLIDERDAMRQQGWTFVRVTGSLHDKVIQGWACVPFTYEAWQHRRPWIRLQVGQDLELCDTRTGASLHQSTPARWVRLPAGSFLLGLNRPWMGLHCLDDLARLAQDEQLPYEVITLAQDQVEVRMTLAAVTLHFDVDLKEDLIQRIRWTQNSQTVGELRFAFDYDHHDQPRALSAPTVSRRPLNSGPSLGLRWLAYLGAEQLTDQF